MKKVDNSSLCQLFIDKPAKNFYPQYYIVIKKPIALKDIINKLRQMEYMFFEEIENDFCLMSDNCRIFNTEA